MASKTAVENKVAELNKLAGFTRFRVIATPIPGKTSTLKDSWSIHDNKTGKNYAWGSIAGTAGLAALTSELKKQQTDATSGASPKKATKSVRHSDDEFIDDESDDDIEHYGVLGMKWGIRKDPKKAYEKANKKLTKLDTKATKQGAKAARKEKRSVVRQRRADTAILFPKTKAKLADWAIGRSEKAQYNYTKRISKATDWYKKMENAFRDVDISSFKESNASYIALGEKYANMQVTDLLSNAQTSVANKQLREYYRRMGK